MPATFAAYPDTDQQDLQRIEALREQLVNGGAPAPKKPMYPCLWWPNSKLSSKHWAGGLELTSPVPAVASAAEAAAAAGAGGQPGGAAEDGALQQLSASQRAARLDQVGPLINSSDRSCLECCHSFVGLLEKCLHCCLPPYTCPSAGRADLLSLSIVA
jgi:hypothetical protein